MMRLIQLLAIVGIVNVIISEGEPTQSPLKVVGGGDNATFETDPQAASTQRWDVTVSSYTTSITCTMRHLSKLTSPGQQRDCTSLVAVSGAVPDLKVTVALTILTDLETGPWRLSLSNGCGQADHLYCTLVNSSLAGTDSFTVWLPVAGIVTVNLILVIVTTFVIVLVVRRDRNRKRDQSSHGAGPHDVKLQKVGRRDDDDDDQNLYTEILSDPLPSAGVPGVYRHRQDLPLPALPEPAPQPIKIANSLSGQRRAGIAPPPTSLNQSAGVDSAACSYYTTPTATSCTEISSNDQSGLPDYLVPIPVTPATLEKKSPDDPSDMSTYLTAAAPPPPKKTSSNDLIVIIVK